MSLEEAITSMLYVAGLHAAKREPRTTIRRGKVTKRPDFALLRCVAGLREQLAERNLLT